MTSSTPWQRQPHIDQGVTAMVCVNPEEMCSGGIVLYRHRPTDLSRVPIGMKAELETLAQQYGFSDHAFRTQDGYAEFINRVFFRPEYAAKENSYINDGNEYWELLYRIDMQPNRLAIFDGRMSHSQHIAPTQFRDYFRMNQILYLQGHDSSESYASGWLRQALGFRGVGIHLRSRLLLSRHSGPLH